MNVKALPCLFGSVTLACVMLASTFIVSNLGFSSTVAILPAVVHAAGGEAPATSSMQQGSPPGARGIGVYPTSLQFDQTIRGGEYYRTIGVINGSDSERTYRFKAGDEIAPWVSVVSTKDRTQVLDTIQAPPWGEGRVFLRVLVPPDAANGTYSGWMQVFTELGEGQAVQGTGASVNLGALVQIRIEVSGTQTIAGSLIDITTSDIEVGMTLRIKATVQNSGNVQVNPDMHLRVIDTTAQVVSESSFSGEVIYPGELSTQIAEWDSRGQAEGQYTAELTMRLGDTPIGTKEVLFDILPFGTLMSSGEIGNVVLVHQPWPGEVAKLEITFHNTGRIDVLSKFVGEVFHESHLMGTVSSEELLVPIGEWVNLELYMAAPEEGEYTIKGKVIYGGKETEPEELTFTVTARENNLLEEASPNPGEGGLPFLLWPVIGVSGIVGTSVLVAGIAMLRRKLRASPFR